MPGRIKVTAPLDLTMLPTNGSASVAVFGKSSNVAERNTGPKLVGLLHNGGRQSPMRHSEIS